MKGDIAMVFAKIRRSDGITEDRIYMNMGMLGHDLFSQKETMIDVLRLEVRGSNYSERKESLRDCAIDFQHKDDGESDYQLSMSERAMIEHWFYMNAKRYGLVEEFSVNGII